MVTAVEVRAIGTRHNNAELIADCARLGYLHEPIIDLTYGHGRFWTTYRPEHLTAIDLDPRRAETYGIRQADFRDTGYASGAFRTVVFDPPYKLNGTSTGRGASAADDAYGVTGYASIAERHQLIFDGITEGVRLTARGGHLLVKCQDQVSSGRVQWQTRLFADHAETCGAHLVDMLHVQGCRPQPAGRRQLHARRDYSTLLVCRKT